MGLPYLSGFHRLDLKVDFTAQRPAYNLFLLCVSACRWKWGGSHVHPELVLSLFHLTSGGDCSPRWTQVINYMCLFHISWSILAQFWVSNLNGYHPNWSKFCCFVVLELVWINVLRSICLVLASLFNIHPILASFM